MVAVLLDLNHAARYGQHLIAMRDGEVVAEGPHAQIVTVELVEHVLGVECLVVPDPVTNTPLVVPLGRSHPPKPEHQHDNPPAGPRHGERP